jgi:hypothetical protein
MLIPFYRKIITILAGLPGGVFQAIGIPGPDA